MPRLGKTQLSRKVKLSRPQIDAYLNRKEPIPPQPDDHGKYDVDEVVKYIALVKDTTQENKTTTYWRSEKLRLDVEEKKAKSAREAGDYIAKADAKKTIEAVMVELAAALAQKFEHELPTRYVGKDAIECAALNANAIDTIILRFKQGLRSLAA